MVKKINDTDYYVDIYGNVYRNDRKLKPQRNRGYLRVKIYPEGKYVYIHRLVASAFIPNPEGKPEVNHLDKDKTNNNVTNLEWSTHSENLKHSHSLGHQKNEGERNNNYKLSNEDISFIRENYVPRHKLLGQRALAKRFNVNQSTISCIIHHLRRT
jgi:hypothetical protein